MVCQKAPSAIRCIKTVGGLAPVDLLGAGRQKAPSAIRYIKTEDTTDVSDSPESLSEST